METLMLSPSEIAKIASLLRDGSIVALPTETVYGLAVRYDDVSAFERLLECKRRPREQAFPLLVPSLEFISQFAEISPQAQRVLQAFLPGPLTVVLPKKKGVAAHIGWGQSSVAIRIPENPLIQLLSCQLNLPLLLTSANLSGDMPVTTSEEAYQLFQHKIAAVVRGQVGSNIPSTIVDLCGSEPRLLRQGTVTLADIQTIWRKQTMNIALGSDHAGFPAKQALKQALIDAGYSVTDYGTHSEQSCHYPTFAFAVGEAVAAHTVDYGILICGTGIGMSIAVNKVEGVRGALVEDVERAVLSRQHNNANVLTLAGRFVPVDQIIAIALTWLQTPFEGGRHQNRLDLMTNYELSRGAKK